MMKFGCAKNWCCHRRLVKQPGERHFAAANSSRLGDFPDAIDYLFIQFLSSGIELFAVIVGLTAYCARLRFPFASKAAARQRAPWQHANSLRKAKRQHLPFFLAIQEIVMRLH